MAGIYVNDEGTWKLPKSIWVNDGTSSSGSTGWRVCKNVYVNRSGAWQEMMKTVDLTSSKSNFNLWEYVGSPTEAISLIFNVSSSVEISSSDPYTNTYPTPRTTAFTVGNFAPGSTVIINNNGYISGGGGFGGSGQWQARRNTYSALAGGAGGIGINKGSYNNYDCTIVNTGTIAGGGGGGGGGPLQYVPPPPCSAVFGCPQGYNAPGKWGGDGAGITGASRTQGGSTYAPSKSQFHPSGYYYPSVAPGGNGGALGDDGQRAPEAPGSGTPGANGGAGAPAIKGGIEIAVSGTIIGRIV